MMNSEIIKSNKECKKYNWLKSKVFISFVILFIVTFIMLLFVNGFSSETAMSHPQFGFKHVYFDDIFPIVSDSIYYRLYFIVDMLFLPSIIFFIISILHLVKSCRSANKFPSYKFFKIAFISVGLVSTIFDWWENIIYINYFPKLFNQITACIVENIKIYSVMLLTGLFIYFFVVYVIYPIRKTIIKFIKSSFISIIILSIIGFGLTFMPQGATLIVHLLDITENNSVANLIVAIFFINILALIVSHFPIYFEMAFNKDDDDEKVVKWNLDNILWGMGIITYEYPSEKNTYKKFARHSLGLLTYTVWFYVIYKAYDLYQLTYMDALPASIIVAIIILGIYYYLFNKVNCIKNKIKSIKNNPNFDPNIPLPEYLLKYINNWSNKFLWSFAITMIYVIVWLCIVQIYKTGWTQLNLYAVLAFTSLNALTYMLFRLTRGLWKHVWGDKKTIINLLAIDHNNHTDLQNEPLLIREQPITKYNIRYYLLKLYSNVNNIKFIRVLGIISAIILAISNILLICSNVTTVSSVVILLAFIINIYAFITVVFKHIIFYRNINSPNNNIYHSDWNKVIHKLKKEKYINFLPKAIIITIVLLIFSTITRKLDNIHQLKFIQYENCIGVEEFSHDLIDRIEKDSLKRMTKIASYGGGLKSNLWTLLVMNEISNNYKKKDKTEHFLDRCISMSGVSGGAVGLGNYLALDYLHRDDPDTIIAKIDKIGKANIVSIDMAGILMHDWWRNHISKGEGEYCVGKDRAYYAMQHYINIIADNDCQNDKLQKSQRHVWSEMYKKHEFIPALIINTASTGPEPGIAFSLDNYKDTIFPGYIDLSSEDKKSDLRYYDAISTSNRFPILSPTAQVEQKGFFLDGGYFENSGLMTSLFFNQYLHEDSSYLNTISTLTISIINGKSNYIENFIDSNDIKINSLNYSSNISSIIMGITNIDKLPNVISKAENRYKSNGDDMCSVYLPHWITVEDIENTICGKIKLDSNILNAIKINNCNIKNALCLAGIKYNKIGIVEPPLARTLSNPAVDYQNAMIKHHVDCRNKIDEIINWL